MPNGQHHRTGLQFIQSAGRSLRQRSPKLEKSVSEAMTSSEIIAEGEGSRVAAVWVGGRDREKSSDLHAILLFARQRFLIRHKTILAAA